MSKRKIAECLNVRINIGNYQHIELTKYAEEEIEFNSVAERVGKEQALCDDLTQSLIRSLKAIPERLGKGVDQAVEVEETIKKAIPAWLEANPVPNIANSNIAKKREIQATAEAKDNKDTISKKQEEVKTEKKEMVASVSVEEPVAEVVDKKEAEALFDDEKTSAKEVKAEVEVKSDNKAKDDDLFGDEDIFS